MNELLAGWGGIRTTTAEKHNKPEKHGTTQNGSCVVNKPPGQVEPHVNGTFSFSFH